MRSATHACRSRCRTRPISVQVAHGEGRASTGGRAARNPVRSSGGFLATPSNAARSRAKCASIVRPRGWLRKLLLARIVGRVNVDEIDRADAIDEDARLLLGVGVVVLLRR